MACRRPEETSTDYAEQEQEHQVGAGDFVRLFPAPAPVLCNLWMFLCLAQFRIPS
jgi:hypothetical protein